MGCSSTGETQPTPSEVKIGRVDGGSCRLTYSGKVDDLVCKFLLDTGADVSILSSRFVQPERNRVPVSGIHLKYPTGEFVPAKCKVEVEVSLGRHSLRLPIYVADISCDCILGTDFLSATGLTDKINQVVSEDLDGSKTFQVGRISSLIGPSTVLSGVLKEVFEANSSELNDEQKEAFKDLLLEFQDVFSDEIIAGNYEGVQHQIKLKEGAQPIKQNTRKVPMHVEAEVNKLLEEMKEKGVIEESQSPWVSPVLLVKKKDGSIRFCVDYRKLNDVTVKDSFPLPKIDDLLDRLAGYSWYSTLDLKSGYWQVKVDPADRPKTAFSIGKGLWQFVVMSFGLCNAPATFQRLMEEELRDLLYQICLVYLDDVITFGNSFDQVLDRLKQIFLRFRKAGLKISPKKCVFFSRKIKYLGHIISKKGKETDPEKIEAVAGWPLPNTKKQLKSFLGFCSYYRKFVKGFSSIAKPLYAMTEGKGKLHWTDERMEDFDRLKKALSSPPMLALPVGKGGFILDTDASNHGIGAVLSQVQDGQERVIAYYSHTLSKEEQRYCVTRRELLAIVEAIKFFRHYLYGRRFTVRTDHSSLRWLLSFKDLEGQLARWIERLQEYDFEIIYREGKSHVNADVLSRRPCVETGCKYCEKVEAKEGSAQEKVVASISLGVNVSEDWRDSQSQDEELQVIMQALKEGVRPSWQSISSSGHVTKAYWSQWDSLVLTEGILYRKWINPRTDSVLLQLVVPKNRIPEVLKEAHDSPSGGHFGVNRTLDRVRRRFFWANCRASVEQWCRSCKDCVAKAGPPDKGKHAFQIYNSGVPFERLQADILGPFPRSKKGNRYLLVVTDCFTKWVEAIPLSNMRAATVAEALVNEVISRHGVPLELHTDQGRNFDSRLLKALSSLLGIHKTRTTPLHPQSDGQVERQHRTILNYLSKFVSDNQKDWDTWVPLFLLAYRSSKHETTGFSPAESYTGQDLRLPLDLLRGIPPNGIDETSTIPDYVSAVRQKLESVHQAVRGKLKMKSNYVKSLYDRKVKKNLFEEGQKVWLYNPHRQVGKTPKLQSNWEGPYVVLKRVNDVVYSIQKSPKHRKKIVHADRLATYVDRNLSSSRFSSRGFP